MVRWENTLTKWTVALQQHTVQLEHTSDQIHFKQTQSILQTTDGKMKARLKANETSCSTDSFGVIF